MRDEDEWMRMNRNGWGRSVIQDAWCMIRVSWAMRHDDVIAVDGDADNVDGSCAHIRPIEHTRAHVCANARRTQGRMPTGTHAHVHTYTHARMPALCAFTCPPAPCSAARLPVHMLVCPAAQLVSRPPACLPVCSSAV